MKKLIILLTVLGLTAFSLQGYSQTNFGIKAGLNVNNISQDIKGDWEIHTKMKAGFHIGPTLDIGFSDQFGLQTGLIFTSKGFSFDLDEMMDDVLDDMGGLPDGGSMDIDGYIRVRYNYFEIPFNFNFKANDFRVYAGPYIAFGIGGKYVADATIKATRPDDEEIFEDTMDDEFDFKPVFGDYDPADLDDDEDAFNALDFGLNFGLGYQVGPILLNAGYSLGLGNITPGREDRDDFDPADEKMSNRVITVSASFLF